MKPKQAVNPFAVAPECFSVSFTVPMAFAVAFEESFSDVAMAASSFEIPETPEFWRVELLVPEMPDESLHARIQELAKQVDIPAPNVQVAQVPRQDWLSAVARDFPPLKIGRFFVYGGHARHLRPAGAVGIQVEAGTAFGSGEHATTSGCLRAVGWLAQRLKVARVLDVGCGSGILAIAAAKCWPRAVVVAGDLDAESVRVARINMHINRVRRVRCVRANGYQHRAIYAQKPYHLIMANILANPLIALSHDLRRNLAPGGVAVLSGLLNTQAASVLAAHRRQGLRLVKHLRISGWSTLVLCR